MIDWAALDAARAPLAPLVGPFPHRGFLEAWWSHHGSGTLVVADEGGCSWAVVIDGGEVRVAGDPELTDYHSPLGEPPADLIAAVLAAAGAGARISFDSLPIEAAEPVAKAVSLCAAGVAVEPASATLVLDIAAGDHPVDLKPRQRHEVRRKERRLAELLGETSLVADQERFADFVALHRGSPGAKGRFMTPVMESFFSELLADVGARVETLVTGSGRAVASAFGFQDEDAYYLYNSAFDPAVAAGSPGIVLLSRLIARAAADGLQRFDFLKGDDDYKRRFGAHPRPLFTVRGVV